MIIENKNDRLDNVLMKAPLNFKTPCESMLSETTISYHLTNSQILETYWCLLYNYLFGECYKL